MAPASSRLPPFRSYKRTNSISSRIEVDAIRRVEEESEAVLPSTFAPSFTFFRFRTNCTQQVKSVLNKICALRLSWALRKSSHGGFESVSLGALHATDCRRDPSATFSLLTRSGGRKKCGKRLLVVLEPLRPLEARAASWRSLRSGGKRIILQGAMNGSEWSQEREGGISLLLFTAIFLADLLIK